MMNLTLFAVGIFFVLSLLGAVVLFHFLKSYAFIQTPRYQAGGAVAGFILIYGILYASHYQIEKTGYQKIKEDYDLLKTEHEGLLKKREISGSITPYLENTKIILGVKEIAPNPDGKFLLRAQCIDPKEDIIGVYAIMENEHRFINIFNDEEMKNIIIPLDKN